MRLIDADQMAIDESEAYLSAQCQIKDELARSVNAVVHTKIQRLIADTPTVDAAPLVHGRWIQTDKADIVWRECSVCGDRRISTWFGKNVKAFNYCPKCGAKMDAEDKP